MSRVLPLGLGVLTGIAAETKIARRLTHNVLCSGGDPAAAARCAEELIANGATMLMSFGIAGGLAPALPSGTLLVADRIVADDGDLPACSEGVSMIGAIIGPIYDGATIVASVREKAALYARTGALAVDLESGPAARVAATAGVPFMALRAIADPAWRALPPAALIPLDAEGNPRLPAVLQSVARRPGQIPSLLKTARETQAALNALTRASRLLAA